MTSPTNSPAPDLPPPLARARDTLATVAARGDQLDNDIRLTAVEAFDIIETESDLDHPPADLASLAPPLTRPAAHAALAAACRDLQTTADVAPARQALAAAHAARVLTTAGFIPAGGM